MADIGKERMFWMIISPTVPSQKINVVFPLSIERLSTKFEAVSVAQKLAKQYPGNLFYVMCAEHVVHQPNLPELEERDLVRDK